MKIAKGQRTQDSRLSRRSVGLLLGAGVLVILIGIFEMIRPNLLMPAKRQTLQIGGQNVVMETRRIIAVPRAVSGLLILSGIGLIFISFQKP